MVVFFTGLELLYSQMAPEVRSGNVLKKPLIVLNFHKTKQNGAVPTYSSGEEIPSPEIC